MYAAQRLLQFLIRLVPGAPVARHAAWVLAAYTLVGGAAWLAAAPVAGAQTPADAQALADTQSTDIHAALAERTVDGRTAHEDERHADAIHHLQGVVALQPGFRTFGAAPAAYWLGAAYAAQGDSLQAHAAWRAGINALKATDAFDVRLADAYLRSVFARGIDRENRSAAAVYLRLLEHAETATGPEREIVHRHAAQMIFLMSESWQQRVTPDVEALEHGDGELKPGAGAQLAAWWRRQDPRPATVVNERILEHLQRVRVAERRYGYDRHLIGFDDRGRVYVRLGPPSSQYALTSQYLAQSVSGQAAFVPQNEYWRYDAFGRYAHYLFVKQGGRYQVGGVPDLLPSSLRHSMGGTGALAALALRDFYDAFVPRIPEYGPLFDATSETVAAIKQAANLQLTTASRLADTGNARPDAEVPGIDRVFMHEARRVQHEMARRRESVVPAVHSPTADGARQLPVDVHTARFLDTDGTTRTEIYWTVPPRGLAAPVARTRLEQAGYRQPLGQHLVQLTVHRHTPDYQAQRVARSHHRFPALPSDASDTPVFSMSVPKNQGGYHLSLQWDQYAVPSGDEQPAVHVQTGARWVDSLEALSQDPATLVMSDLVPLRGDAIDASSPVRDERGFRVPPRPSHSVTPDTKLGLYFEAYHLTYGADDQTRYTVEYAVQRRRERSGLGRLFGGQWKTEETSASTTYSGRERTAKEYLVLDLSSWDEAEELTVTVRVIDEITGRRAERSAAFQVARDE